uniref:Uncharacterized protein n=1 Tax=Anguilla anguilla TaxID=7936 RepID=A0A0E9XQ30_ANGAN
MTSYMLVELVRYLNHRLYKTASTSYELVGGNIMLC